MESVTIRVPATTANLGPGYDCLGVALQIYNCVTVDRMTPGKDTTSGEMASKTAEAFFATAALEPFEFSWKVEGDVPQSRGLGSSVTVRLGLLMALNELSETKLTRHQLFEICAQLEGHPDNAAPAAFGGFTVAGGIQIARFEVDPKLRFILLIPDFEIATPAARKVLPVQLDRLEAVKSGANACRITAAFASKNYGLLRGAFADGLHQPFRESLIPFLFPVINAGESAGALGGFLSGSGSTICCVTLDEPERVASAMLKASNSPGARTVVTAADNGGASLFPQSAEMVVETGVVAAGSGRAIHNPQSNAPLA